jgi:hypothetical protein
MLRKFCALFCVVALTFVTVGCEPAAEATATPAVETTDDGTTADAAVETTEETAP